jgi:hypothetical protein
MHRVEHLHIAPRAWPEATRQPARHDVDDHVGHTAGIVLGKEKEVWQPGDLGEITGPPYLYTSRPLTSGGFWADLQGVQQG